MTKILEDCHQFPYEVELEGEASRWVGAIKWARLAVTPKVGDRVKVLGGIIHAFAPPDSYSAFRKEPSNESTALILRGYAQMTLRQMEVVTGNSIVEYPTEWPF